MSPRTLAPDVPAALEAICLRALAKAPADRYPSAQALGEALERFLSGEPAPGPRRWLVPAARIGALVVCAAAAFALLRPGAAPEDHAQPAPASGGLDPAPGDGRAPSLEAVAGRVTAAALAGDGVAAAAQALLDRLDAAGRELLPAGPVRRRTTGARWRPRSPGPEGRPARRSG